MSSPRYLLAVSLQPADATTTLFFEHLKAFSDTPIKIVTPKEPRLAELIAGAEAVIVVRALFECAHVAWCARAAGVPHYYFLDDNFLVLREQGGESARFVTRYSPEAVEAALRSFDGVLLATEPLLDYFTARGLHDEVLLFPPAARPGSPLPKPASSSVRVAFFGGQHLHRAFTDVLLPAVRRLGTERETTLIVMGVPARLSDSEGLTIVQLPYEPSYAGGVSELASRGVDILVHPSAAGMRNNAYKNVHALITANALGAVPIVTNAPPYDSLRGRDVVLLSDDNQQAWFESLTVAADRAFRDRLTARLADYCASTFDGSRNRAAIATMARGPRPGRTMPVWMLQCGMTVAQLARSFGAIRDRLSTGPA